MAVTVEGNRWIVLDEKYRVVEVGSVGLPEFGHFFGQSVWELLPGSRDVFLPYLEEARRTGEAAEFVQFYRGAAIRVGVIPDQGRLAVSWKVLGTVDVSTLDTLRDSLLGIVTILEERVPLDRRFRPLLRVVEGGGQV